MCPKKPTAKEGGAVVDNSHNESTGISILSIHTETVFSTLSVVAVLIILILLAVFLYRKYIKGRIMRGAAALVTAPAGPPPSYLAPPPPYAPTVQYIPVRNTPALMQEGVEMSRPMARHLSQDQLEDVARVLRQCSNTT